MKPRVSFDDRFFTYQHAMAQLARQSQNNIWLVRANALTDFRFAKRENWLRWVEEEAHKDDGIPWCKELVTRAVTLRIDQ